MSGPSRCAWPYRARGYSALRLRAARSPPLPRDLRRIRRDLGLDLLAIGRLIARDFLVRLLHLLELLVGGRHVAGQRGLLLLGEFDERRLDRLSRVGLPAWRHPSSSSSS